MVRCIAKTNMTGSQMTVAVAGQTRTGSQKIYGHNFKAYNSLKIFQNEAGNLTSWKKANDLLQTHTLPKITRL